MELRRTGLARAVRDLRYLLNQGYPRESAVNFVSNHYRFPLDKRHLLARCVFSRREVIKHRKKIVGAREVSGKRLGVDGYNVLITVESILGKEQVVRCDDGLIRDLRALFGKYRMGPRTPRALAEVLWSIAQAKPERVDFLYDKQVSRSGELAALTRGQLKRFGIRGDARTLTEVDREIRGFDVVASSDRGIIGRAKAVWDIPGEILRRRKARLLSLD